jgi:hypothetical protein
VQNLFKIFLRKKTFRSIRRLEEAIAMI